MHRWLIVFLLACSAATAQTQTKNPWAEWEPFLGTWQGTGGGGPGQGSGEFTFALELQGAVLTRHNYAEYPASKDKTAFRHDDLMVIYHDAENSTRADYWDSEGHVIHYSVSLSPVGLSLASDPAQPGPLYRLTYLKTDANSVKITFEIAPPTDRTAFKTYIEATAHRKGEARK